MTTHDPSMTARAIIERAHNALREACSDMMMSDEGRAAAVIAALEDLIVLSERAHQLATGVRARDVIHAINHGKRGKAKARALEALRALRGLEHSMNLADDKAFSDFVKKGEDWAAMRKEVSDLRALAKREMANAPSLDPATAALLRATERAQQLARRHAEGIAEVEEAFAARTSEAKG